jgi:ABC-type uncharacterized transport system substrate-binding protein
VYADDFEGKKVLCIDSYHEGYEWSDSVISGVVDGLKGSGVELRIYRMDTKRNISEEFKKQAAILANDMIKKYKPDLIIAADDNASKYLIEPYYKDIDLPIVFCGVNWDETVYGYPYSNATGMVEVSLISKLIEELLNYSKGNRIGFLGGDVLTDRKEAESYKKIFHITLTEMYAKTFSEWKRYFLKMQNEVDILIVYNDAGVEGWDAVEAEVFVKENTFIPTGSVLDWMAKYVLMTLAKEGEEQGEYAAQTALRILNGEDPKDIPIVRNKNGKVYLNINIADKLGVVLRPRLLKQAEIIF